MTPTELLDEAKSKFIVLYHKNETALGLLLKEALGKYQEKAGSVGIIKLTLEDEGSIAIPNDLLEIMTALDADTRYVESSIEAGQIIIDAPEDDTEFPVTVHYFHNLREWDTDTDLPTGVSSLLLDYLVALIDVPNTDRDRARSAAVGEQVEFPSQQELKDRVLQLEGAMEDSKAICIPIAVW